MYFHFWLAMAASACAMFIKANSRACPQRSSPLPPTMVRVLAFQLALPPGQKRAMSVSSESALAAEPRTRASPRLFTSLYSAVYASPRRSKIAPGSTSNCALWLIENVVTLAQFANNGVVTAGNSGLGVG